MVVYNWEWRCLQYLILKLVKIYFAKHHISDYLSFLQSGVVTILRPDLLDFESQQQFIVTIEAYDTVLPLNQRRQVYYTHCI